MLILKIYRPSILLVVLFLLRNSVKVYYLYYAIKDGLGKLPDRPFHNFWALKHAAQRSWTA